MSQLRALWFLTAALLVGALAVTLAASPAAVAAAEPGAEATWSGNEQPTAAGAAWPVGLGNIGDIQFWAPDRGMLITEGHPPTLPAGLWSYNGTGWHEYATECGASENEPDNGGRIAWASPDEFWTVSNGRKGQANESAGGLGEREPPLEDNTLCHFVAGQIAGSYAHPAFQVNSYQPMHAAACLGANDCWFGGDPLEEPLLGAFHLHWNGSRWKSNPRMAKATRSRTCSRWKAASMRACFSHAPIAGRAATPSVIHRIAPEGAAADFRSRRRDLRRIAGNAL